MPRMPQYCAPKIVTNSANSGGREEGGGAPGRGVEAEDLALAPGRDEAGQEGAARRLGGADEEAQGEAADPEHDRAAVVQRRRRPRPLTIRPMSAVTMTGFGPNRSSSVRRRSSRCRRRRSRRWRR